MILLVIDLGDRNFSGFFAVGDRDFLHFSLFSLSLAIVVLFFEKDAILEGHGLCIFGLCIFCYILVN